jgi:hypothetical protein
LSLSSPTRFDLVVVLVGLGCTETQTGEKVREGVGIARRAGAAGE